MFTDSIENAIRSAVGKPFEESGLRTRDGQRVRIFACDLPNRSLVVAGHIEGGFVPAVWRLDGSVHQELISGPVPPNAEDLVVESLAMRALRAAEELLSEYADLYPGDKDLTERVLPLVRLALDEATRPPAVKEVRFAIGEATLPPVIKE